MTLTAIGGRRPLTHQVNGERATAWRRVAARLADLATVLFVQWALTVIHVFFFVPLLVDRVSPGPWGRAFVPTVLFVALTASYEVLFLARNEGRTPGKDLFRIKVVTKDGTPPAAVVALVRSLPLGLVLFVAPWWLALLLLPVLGAPSVVGRGRSLLDVVAHTEVVADPRNEEMVQ